MASAAEDDMFADSDAEPEAKTERGGAVQPPTADAPSPPGMPEAGKEALPEEGGKGAMRELKRARPEGDGPNGDGGVFKRRSAAAFRDLEAAASEDRGTRATMEDVHVVSVDAREDKNSTLRVSYFAIFDGHGGHQSARFAAEHLHSRVMAAGLVTSEGGDQQQQNRAGVKAIFEGFKVTDAELIAECNRRDWQDGATAVAVWVVGNTVFVGNVGDAKCVLGRISDKDESKDQLKALMLTKEHLAIYPQERARIERSGGSVTEGRLAGRLQVSRSLGDKQFKKAGLSAVPNVQAFELTSRDQFMVCGCDGFWKVFDGQGAVDMVAELLEEGRDEKSVCNRILNEAVRNRRCNDNCTVLLIKFAPSG